MTDINERAQEIAEEARGSFDLGARLRGRSVRTAEIRVYTDEVLAEEIGGAEPIQTRNDYGMLVTEIRKWGLTGQIVDLARTPESEVENAKEIKKLKAKLTKLAKQLEDSALDITLRSIPPIIKKDARRAAKATLGIKGKVTDGHEKFEEFLDELDAEYLKRAVVSIFDHESGLTNHGVDVNSARDLKGFLPESEYGKLVGKLNELLWEKVIADKATEDADF